MKFTALTVCHSDHCTFSFRPPADRSKNPWQTTEYKSKYTNLLVLMEDSDILAKCFSLGMISESMRLAISEVTDSRHRKEKLLSSISTTTKNFVKFREILRTDSIERYADYMDDLDSVGPDPEGQSIPNIPYVLQLCIEMLFLLDRETAQQNVIKLILLTRVDCRRVQSCT